MSKGLLLTVGVILALATLGAWLAGIWVGDERWGYTGILTMFMAYGAFAWAAFTKSHAEKCGGC